ncbi:diaminopimelate decarboxylase, partial [PVC group bacterium]|nr:diaminopimelate decarboxylase [PVC group bacterium]
ILTYIKKLNVRLILEPGRFIAGNAGIFVTRVEYVKKTGKKNFVIVDGAMNDLIRPSLYEAYHEIVPVKKTKGAIVADIVGPVCETGDFFAKGRKVANVKEGDLLACLSAGAYGFVMASNYNTRPRVPEVFVDKNKMRVIRRRERVEDLLRLEY